MLSILHSPSSPLHSTGTYLKGLNELFVWSSNCSGFRYPDPYWRDCPCNRNAMFDGCRVWEGRSCAQENPCQGWHCGSHGIPETWRGSRGMAAAGHENFRNDGFPSGVSGHLSLCVWGISESFQSQMAGTAGAPVAREMGAPGSERLGPHDCPGRLLNGLSATLRAKHVAVRSRPSSSLPAGDKDL